jgi:putative flavoprotein involved in K+ transport
MDGARGAERLETVIVGGGQAGLSVGYQLARRERPFVILDANRRIGDAWRSRWDSLRLFTPARHDGLPGWRFPAPARSYPTRDQVADYLEVYAARFDLPVRGSVRVDGLSRDGDRYLVAAGDRRLAADHVVVATGAYQRPRIPAFAAELDPGILQLDPHRYRGPSQLVEGGVLVVGAGNSGAEIAFEVARTHPTWLSVPDTGHLPVRTESVWDRLLTPPFWWFASHVLTVSTPVGRRVRPKFLEGAAPLERVRPKELAAAGVQRAPQTVGCATAARCWRTAASWRWRPCSGARASGRTSAGSTCRSSARTGYRRTGVAWWKASPACTSWACSSCTGSPPRCWAGSGGTPSTSPSSSPRASAKAGDRCIVHS